jgi:hypothetical protein
MRQTLTALVLLLFSPALAYGQEVWVAANAGAQFASNDFAHVVEVPLFQTALRADYPVSQGGVFDMGAGMTFPWGIGLGPVRVGLGASFSVATVGHDAAVQAEIRTSLLPGSPFRFEGVKAVDRTETSAHIHVAGTVPVGERATVSVYGGPSYFAVIQGVISDLDIPLLGSGPITRLDAREVHANWWGFNAGADVAFFLTPRIGVGLGVRVTGATVRVENLLLGAAAAERGRVASRAGGVQMLAGLRLRLP